MMSPKNPSPRLLTTLLAIQPAIRPRTIHPMIDMLRSWAISRGKRRRRAPRSPVRSYAIALAVIGMLALAGSGRAGPLTAPWPDPGTDAIAPVTVGFPSTSPFIPRDIGGEDAAPTAAVAYF